MTSVFKTSDGRMAVEISYLQLLDRWLPAARRHRLKTSQGDTFIVESGPEDAPAVLLFHGTAATSAMWLADIPLWAERFRLVAVDIIGDAGLSAPERPSMTTDAHARWIEEILEGLGLRRAALVGVSFGGWVALDYATRRPERVDRLVLINPGGVGRPRNVLLWALPLLLLGGWGRRKLLEQIAGKPEPNLSDQERDIGAFSELIFRHFRPRTAALPQIADGALERLTMPVLAILGGRDVFIDASGARRRLEAHVPQLTVRYLPEGRHFIPGQAGPIGDFLPDAASPATGRAP